jgi:hypothetical protein
MEDKIDKAIYDFIILPAIVLIGLYITAALIDTMLGTPNSTFRILFVGVGGILYFINYFRRKMSNL